jgi:hypothetical protein
VMDADHVSEATLLLRPPLFVLAWRPTPQPCLP